MSTRTPNYSLIKPELTDPANITTMNENWDKIDEQLKKAEDHTHTPNSIGAADNYLSNVDDTVFKNKAVTNGVGIPICDAYSSDGIAYAVALFGFPALTNGMKITIIPNMTSTSVSTTLDVNGTGAKTIAMGNSGWYTYFNTPNSPYWITAGRPITLYYNDSFDCWVAEQVVMTPASNIVGNLTVEQGGTGLDYIPTHYLIEGTGGSSARAISPSEALQNMISMVTASTTRGLMGAQSQITSGTDEPTGGSDGDVYIQIID